MSKMVKPLLEIYFWAKKNPAGAGLGMEDLG